MSSEMVMVQREKLDDLIRAVRSINHGKSHEIMIDGDDEPCLPQRKEWVEWVLGLCDEIIDEVDRINDKPTS
jgi:hypothetical protein